MSLTDCWWRICWPEKCLAVTDSQKTSRLPFPLYHNVPSLMFLLKDDYTNVVFSHSAQKCVVRMICFHYYGSEMLSLRFMVVMPLISVTTTCLLFELAFSIFRWIKLNFVSFSLMYFQTQDVYLLYVRIVSLNAIVSSLLRQLLYQQKSDFSFFAKDRVDKSVESNISEPNRTQPNTSIWKTRWHKKLAQHYCADFSEFAFWESVLTLSYNSCQYLIRYNQTIDLIRNFNIM